MTNERLYRPSSDGGHVLFGVQPNTRRDRGPYRGRCPPRLTRVDAVRNAELFCCWPGPAAVCEVAEGADCAVEGITAGVTVIDVSRYGGPPVDGIARPGGSARPAEPRQRSRTRRRSAAKTAVVDSRRTCPHGAGREWPAGLTRGLASLPQAKHAGRCASLRGGG
jgi:hypothetical protein